MCTCATCARRSTPLLASHSSIRPVAWAIPCVRRSRLPATRPPRGGSARVPGRAPLTVLQGMMEVALLRDRSTDEYQEVLRRAVAETMRMGMLITDLLALARTQGQQEIMVRHPLDLREVAREAAESVRPLAERKG